MVFDGVNIWIANVGGNNLRKLKAADGTNLGSFAAGNGPIVLAFDGAYIWSASSFGGSITRH